MVTSELTHVTEELKQFINKCKVLGYKNNDSLKSLKWDWCLAEGGMWHATYDDTGVMVALSGIHPFKEGYRALFRGAQVSLRSTRGLNRNMMQSWGMYDQMPLQINFADGKPIYITTNVSNDASGRMNRIHNSCKVMARNGMIDYISDEEIFGTNQSVWQLNTEIYSKIRSLNED